MMKVIRNKLKTMKVPGLKHGMKSDSAYVAMIDLKELSDKHLPESLKEELGEYSNMIQ
jgi:hypothetical protein